jgi:hypothetical protein
MTPFAFSAKKQHNASRTDPEREGSAQANDRGAVPIGGLRVARLHRGSRQPSDGRTAMAKGQKRTSREAKKPKADKKKVAPPPGTVSNAFAKPKAAAPAAEKRK